jgi:hypothetical protein
MELKRDADTHILPIRSLVAGEMLQYAHYARRRNRDHIQP